MTLEKHFHQSKYSVVNGGVDPDLTEVGLPNVRYSGAHRWYDAEGEFAKYLVWFFDVKFVKYLVWFFVAK